ncbi:S8 family serine peptidase [Lysobacter sp. GX 14042]|uniref:S8 family serine peptidase n=1 Tax=Lysobacter sp. GX 14042 TaxID=2907155 RepID=UPI001F44CE8D|nr:S8 family serine peptidase [Lysobacter sp. GX 14042]MCE7032209.1 S8 family serine peptidase [Lysobacter sp. GX 14042]
MSTADRRSLRRTALAVATAAVLAVAATTASAAGDAVINTSSLESGESHDRFIVKYREGSPQRSSDSALQQSLQTAGRASLQGSALGLQKLRRTATGAEVLQTARKLDRADAEALMRRLAADPAVEYVEVDQKMYPALTPNDTYYTSNQWHYFESTGGIRANQAWDRTTGAGVVVAVLDTGITNHSDLNANILPGYDFISDATVAGDGNGRDSDPSDPGDYYGGDSSSWHGTHVAGTIAAVTNNNKGVAGVAHGARVVPVRVLGRGGGYLSDIADGIVWAAGGSVSGVPANANPAEVINMSLGGSGSCSSTYQSAINSAVNRGTTVVVAAGNSNANVSGFNPGNCSNVVSVASTTRQGARSSFSNYGSLIDVSAPGSDIASTINTGSTTPSAEGYSLMSGTSMAAPHVAGVVALMQAAAGGGLTPAQVEQTLKSTARSLPGSCSSGCGAGIVDANAAVAAVAGGGNPGGPGQPGDPGGGTQTYSNGGDYAIPSPGTVDSPISISGRSGNAPNPTRVDVDIRHSYRGDLQVDLVAPDGSTYRIKSANGSDSADNVIGYANLNLSSEQINGTWRLRVRDHYSGDTGYINSWSITF